MSHSQSVFPPWIFSMTGDSKSEFASSLMPNATGITIPVEKTSNTSSLDPPDLIARHAETLASILCHGGRPKRGVRVAGLERCCTTLALNMAFPGMIQT